MGYFGYRKRLRALKDRLAAVNDHPRLADEVFFRPFSQQHQLRVLSERATTLGA